MLTFKSLEDAGAHLLGLPDDQSAIDYHIYKSDLDRLLKFDAGKKPADVEYKRLIEEVQAREYPNNNRPFHEFRERLDDCANYEPNTKDADSWAKYLDADYKKNHFKEMHPGEFFSSGMGILGHSIIGEGRPDFKYKDKIIETFNAFVTVSHKVYGVLIKQGYEINKPSKDELIEIFSEQYKCTLSGVYSHEVDLENISLRREMRYGQFDKAMKERIKNILSSKVIPNEEELQLPIL